MAKEIGKKDDNYVDLHDRKGNPIKMPKTDYEMMQKEGDDAEYKRIYDATHKTRGKSR